MCGAPALCLFRSFGALRLAPVRRGWGQSHTRGNGIPPRERVKELYLCLMIFISSIVTFMIVIVA